MSLLVYTVELSTVRSLSSFLFLSQYARDKHCAFVSFRMREDADKCRRELSDARINGSAIKVGVVKEPRGEEYRNFGRPSHFILMSM